MPISAQPGSWRSLVAFLASHQTHSSPTADLREGKPVTPSEVGERMGGEKATDGEWEDPAPGCHAGRARNSIRTEDPPRPPSFSSVVVEGKHEPWRIYEGGRYMVKRCDGFCKPRTIPFLLC